jgi:hypothetical protein
VILAGLAVFAVWGQYQKDHRVMGHYLLFFSLMCLIVGMASFSKRERERDKQIALAAEPERAGLINASENDEKAKQRGYFILGVGIVAFILWTQVYGLSSLSTV